MISLLQVIVEQGLIFSLVLCAVHLTSRVILFDDLTVEGSFGLGGAITACGLINGFNGWTMLFVCLAAGACAGMLTGLIHSMLRVNNLISGIVVMTALYSINLKIASAHVPLMNTGRILESNTSLSLLILVLLSFTAILGLVWILRTELGFMLRAVGINPQIVTSLGKSVALYKIVGLMFANGLTAVAGSLFAQYMGFFSMASSVGVLVIALAGITLGQVIGGKIWRQMLWGALAYPAVLALVLECELDPVYNKLAIALMILLLLIKQRWAAHTIQER